MSNTIDTRFQQEFSRYTSNADRSPGQIDVHQARELVATAQSINASKTHLCGLIKSSKGKKGLTKLFQASSSQFKPLAKAVVDEFITKGRILDAHLSNRYARYTAPTDPTPGVIDRREAMGLMACAVDLNQRGPALSTCFSGGSTQIGTESLGLLLKNTSETFTDEAKKAVQTFIESGKDETIITEFKTPKSTWHCHWFPQKETQPNGGNSSHNLYAKNGALDKYDQVFGSDSRAYELKYNFRPHDSDAKDAHWAGHCNNASEIAAMVKEPQKTVTYQGVTFTPNDIAGLLVKVSDSLRGKIEYVGKRYNDDGDLKSDPAPEVFLKDVLQAWCTETDKPIPFVLDIHRESQVWNYPYDQGRLIESAVPPEEVNPADLPEGGKIIFYTAELMGSDFEQQARKYQFWIQYGEDEAVLKSAWIQGRDSKISPDFAWRPHPRGDLTKKETWMNQSSYQNNPVVKPANVYEIYIRSI